MCLLNYSKKRHRWCSETSVGEQDLTIIDPMDTGLDYGNVAELRLCVDWALKSSGVVILDLAQTPYVDTSALGLVLSLQKELGLQRRQLILVAPTGRKMHEVLLLTRIVRIFSIAENREEALKVLSHPEPAN